MAYRNWVSGFAVLRFCLVDLGRVCTAWNELQIYAKAKNRSNMTEAELAGKVELKSRWRKPLLLWHCNCICRIGFWFWCSYIMLYHNLHQRLKNGCEMLWISLQLLPLCGWDAAAFLWLYWDARWVVLSMWLSGTQKLWGGLSLGRICEAWSVQIFHYSQLLCVCVAFSHCSLSLSLFFGNGFAGKIGLKGILLQLERSKIGKRWSFVRSRCVTH